MANPYFRNIPEFSYVNRTKDGGMDGDFSVVKNFFKRAKLRSDIFENLAFFEKFIVKGDDRPDNVANEIYGDPFLDWVVLLSNNIINWLTDFYDEETSQINFDFEDEVIQSSVLAYDGKIMNERFA